MNDRFSSYAKGLTAPATGIAEITPSDTEDLAQVSRGLIIGGAGEVRVRMLDGSEGTVTLAAGVGIPLRVVRVFATGTTASGIVALY